MGEVRDGDLPDDATVWRALTADSNQYGPGGAAALIDRMSNVVPPTPAGDRPPVIVDTDIGGDPDDAVALAVAAHTCPELALVVTSDERGGDRARFARAFLDALGRHDVPVVAGRDLGNTRYFCVDGLAGARGEPVNTNLLAAVDQVRAGATHDRIRWVGIGPMSNLADLLTERPELTQTLEITQMGAALNYRYPDQAEHNIRLDPAAARTVLAARPRISFVTSDVTFRPDEMAITSDSGVYRHLAEESTTWARMLRAHLDRWYATFYPATLQHDALTFSAALQMPFVDFGLRRVNLDDIGRMSLAADGREAFLSLRADYPAFRAWLQAGLSPPTPTATARQGWG